MEFPPWETSVFIVAMGLIGAQWIILSIVIGAILRQQRQRSATSESGTLHQRGDSETVGQTRRPPSP